MRAAFAKKLASEFLQVTQQVPTLHGTSSSNGSLITLFFPTDSSASVRLASRTSATASFRFARVSRSVRPCVFAPGSSSTNPTYPPLTFLNTAVSFIFYLRIISRRDHFVFAPVDSAISSTRSRTRMVSSSERDFTASSIIVMQNGHPTATHLGFASCS
jgi:hypothetical protein